MALSRLALARRVLSSRACFPVAANARISRSPNFQTARRFTVRPSGLSDSPDVSQQQQRQPLQPRAGVSPAAVNAAPVESTAAPAEELPLIMNFISGPQLKDVASPNALPLIINFHIESVPQCSEITPVLEGFVHRAKGRVRLLNVDHDVQPEIAQHFGVQRFPHVFFLSQGKLVDNFAGSMSQKEVLGLCERLLSTSASSDDQLVQAQLALDAGDLGAAAAIYVRLINDKLFEPEAYAGMIRCALAEPNVAAAEDLAATLKLRFPSSLSNPTIMQALSATELAKSAQTGGSVELLEARLKDEPKNPEIRYQLAVAHFAAGNHKAAIDQAIKSVSIDKQWNEAAARDLLIKIFEALGADNDLAKAGRRRFTSVWLS